MQSLTVCQILSSRSKPQACPQRSVPAAGGDSRPRISRGGCPYWLNGHTHMHTHITYTHVCAHAYTQHTNTCAQGRLRVAASPGGGGQGAAQPLPRGQRVLQGSGELCGYLLRIVHASLSPGPSPEGRAAPPQVVYPREQRPVASVCSVRSRTQCPGPAALQELAWPVSAHLAFIQRVHHGTQPRCGEELGCSINHPRLE